MASWQDSAQNWKSMPLSSSILFFAGVFCLFGSLVLIFSSMTFQKQTIPDMILSVAIGGGIAILWAYAGFRRVYWLLAALAFVQFSVNIFLGRHAQAHPSLEGHPAELHDKLLLNGEVEIVLILVGYALFVLFSIREGRRYYRTQTEVRLAGEIHRTLVPQKHQTIGNFEMFGSSVPSSEVGGDLFDIVESDGTWHAYVADVSGHGVAAGILMSMIKSAASMQLTKLHKPGDLLRDLNDVLQPVTAPANYLTLACVSGTDGNLSYALAGHLPILHYQKQKKSVIEHSDSNLPIGMFQDQTFAVSKLQVEPGDLLAIITDGFTEVADSKEREMGMEDFKSAFGGCAEKPLPEIYKELRARTLKFGKQTDDQTMLLIRRVA
jgi:hypothetical protein